MAIIDELQQGNRYYQPTTSKPNGGRPTTPPVSVPAKKKTTYYVPSSTKSKSPAIQKALNPLYAKLADAQKQKEIMSGVMAAQKAVTAKKTPTKTKAPASSSGGSSYRPYSYSGSSGGYSSGGYSSGGYSSGGGGGGGASASEYEQYGITKPWMEAYKESWGSVLPQKLWGMYEPITSLFTRYMNRLPQLEDWKAIWDASKQYFAENEIDRQHMPMRLELYEPFISNMVRQPLFTPPDVSYSPGMSF